MKKSVAVSVSLLTLLAFSSESFAQQAEERKRRPNFFERLFGVEPRRPARQTQWWEEDSGDVRIIRGGEKKKKAVKTPSAKKAVPTPVVPIDPEVAAGLGMGNLDYVPPKLVAVSDPAIGKSVTTETGTSAIQLVLADRATTVRATADVRKVVLDHYRTSGFKPLWTENGNLSVRGLALLGHLAKADREGLEPARYKPAVLDSFEGAVSAMDGDTLGLAQLDVGLTVAALTYALHVSGGAFDPAALSGYYDIKPERVSPEVALKVLAYSPYPVAYLEGIAPQHPAYAALKAELASLAKPATEAKPLFAEGKRIRIGQKDLRIIQLRQRLVDDGYIGFAEAFRNDGKDAVLDKELARALKRFQAARGVGQTSNLDNATVKALNGPSIPENRSKVIASLERLRWMPRDLGNRYVFVNQAAQHLTVMDSGKMVWSTNVVVGKPLTQTNVFSDTFDDIVVNPTWTMPQGIFLRDYLPKSRANASYIDKKGYKIYNKDGKVVSSRSINWNAVSTNANFRITQPAGDGNALGQLKFNFPNRHAIYLHDTPQKELFAESERVFSNGCVRVEDPKRLAEVLLGMDTPALEAVIKKGATRSLKVPGNTRVHLQYLTAWPDEDGRIQYFSDPYLRDATLLKAMDATARLTRKDTTKLVENSSAVIID